MRKSVLTRRQRCATKAPWTSSSVGGCPAVSCTCGGLVILGGMGVVGLVGMRPSGRLSGLLSGSQGSMQPPSPLVRRSFRDASFALEFSQSSARAAWRAADLFTFLPTLSFLQVRYVIWCGASILAWLALVFPNFLCKQLHFLSVTVLCSGPSPPSSGTPRRLARGVPTAGTIF